MKSFTLFPNGTSFMVWTSRNCDRCWKRATPNTQGRNHNCAIETAIALASATDGTLLNDGLRSEKQAEKIAARLHWDGVEYLETDCPEREEKRPKRPKRPKRELAQPMLPALAPSVATQEALL